jgi:hypothetical protein
LVLAELPGPFGDYLVCGISSQLHQETPQWDECLTPTDADFPTSGLKVASVSRLEINCWFTTAQRSHNVVIEVSVGLKADFHDCVDDGLLVVAWCCCLKAISF